MSINKTFDKFIKEAEELGEIAHYENGHGQGVDTKETALDSLEEYGKFIDKLNKSFEAFENEVNKKYAK